MKKGDTYVLFIFSYICWLINNFTALLLLFSYSNFSHPHSYKYKEHRHRKSCNLWINCICNYTHSSSKWHQSGSLFYSQYLVFWESMNFLNFMLSQILKTFLVLGVHDFSFTTYRVPHPNPNCHSTVHSTMRVRIRYGYGRTYIFSFL